MDIDEPPITELTAEAKFQLGLSMMAISSILIIAPLTSHFVRIKSFVLSPQLVAMFLGIFAAALGSVMDKYHLINFSLHQSHHYALLPTYYTLMILRFVYLNDTYIFFKSLSQSLIISVLGWISTVMIFGFLLISFAGGLSTFHFNHWLLLGVIFAPIEMPSILFDLERLRRVEVIMCCESVFTSILSIICLNLLLGVSAEIFDEWYQPICVFLRLTVIATIIGLTMGWLASILIPRYATHSGYTTIALAAWNYMVYHLTQYVFASDGGLSCLIFVAMISRVRLQIPAEIERDVSEQIKMWYYCVSTVVNFMCVCEALWPFISIYTIMVTAVSLALYICTMACRLLFFICISPFLSRLGYGFNFKSMVTMVWCIKKGPLPFLMVSILVYNNKGEVIVPMDLLVLGLNYAFLVNILNEFFSWTALCLMGLAGDDPLLSQVNLMKTLNYLEEKRKDHLAVMKLHRFYVNANWKLVHNSTSNLIQGKVSTEIRENDMAYEDKAPYCKLCKKDVSYQLSQTEKNALLNALRLRVLHASRVSFAKQFEKGFLEDDSLRTLNHFLEVAMESPDRVINIEPVLVMLRKSRSNKHVEKLRSFLVAYDRHSAQSNANPKYLKYYRLMTNAWFVTFFDIIALGHVCLTVFMFKKGYDIYLDLANSIFLALFYVEFTVAFVGSITVNARDGFQTYWRKPWNKFNFLLLMSNTLDFCLIIAKVRLMLTMFVAELQMLIFTLVLFRLLRLLRLITLIGKLQFFIVIWYDRYVASHIHRAYNIGRGIVLAYEELDEVLHIMSKNKGVLYLVRTQLKEDRIKISKEMGNIEMAWPSLSKCFKTRQAMLYSVWTLGNTMKQLYTDGHMNNEEYHKIRCYIFEQQRRVKGRHIPKDTNMRILEEFPWLDEDTEVFDILKDKVQTMVWNAGDMVYKKGDVADSVIIIVTGLFKIVYTPDYKALHDLRHYGQLPVMDMINHAKFNFPKEEYVFKGNSVGELSVLSGRPYCCDIIADLPSQGYVIPQDVLIDVLQLTPDPINGTFSKIWKHITQNLVRRLLEKIPVYKSVKIDTLNEIIARSFIARLDSFSVFHVNDSIEDIVLVEGTLTDYTTRVIFTAPSVLPKSSTKLLIPNTPSPYDFRVQPIIWIIPQKDMNPYNVLLQSELVSELNEKSLRKPKNAASMITTLEQPTSEDDEEKESAQAKKIKVCAVGCQCGQMLYNQKRRKRKHSM